jgi:hypothetical protein
LNSVDSGHIQASTAAAAAAHGGKRRLPIRQVTTATSAARSIGVRLRVKADEPNAAKTPATT